METFINSEIPIKITKYNIINDFDENPSQLHIVYYIYKG